MVLETLPVYFDYDEKTWLIQIWKGQYGICTGCEVGVYHADQIVAPKDRETTIFQAVDEQEMPELSTVLWREESLIVSLKKRHWWLTAFDVGRFLNTEMKEAFCKGLLEQGINTRDIISGFTTVYFYMPFACRYVLRHLFF